MRAGRLNTIDLTNKLKYWPNITIVGGGIHVKNLTLVELGYAEA